MIFLSLEITLLNEEEVVDKDQWMEEVVKLAKNYGFSAQQVLMFSMDIEMCYNEGDSPEQCVSKVF